MHIDMVASESHYMFHLMHSNLVCLPLQALTGH